MNGIGIKIDDHCIKYVRPFAYCFVFCALMVLNSCSSEDSIMTIYSTSLEMNKSHKKWETDKQQIINSLNTINPDVVVFQHVDKVQSVSLAIDLPHYAYIEPISELLTGQDKTLPIYFMKNRFELISKSYFQISDNRKLSNDSITGFVSWIKLKQLNTGYIFFVFNCSNKQSSFLQSEDFYSILIHKIKAISGSAPVMLLGNSIAMNDNNKSDASKVFLIDSRILKDQIEQRSDSGYTNIINQPNSQLFINRYFKLEEFFDLKADSTLPLVVKLSFNYTEDSAN
jgi:hypothetical protein